ncbi:MAG TPA: hypothetical protein VFO85_17925, partial [Vicinamibacteria bacterium]|nr:hypothetical protein [Vicinamibacteria bacterium]
MTVIEPPMPALSLEEWRRVFNLHPFHFYGMSNSTTLQVVTQSDPVLREYAWQNIDDVGRADIVEAIRAAELKLRAFCRFRPGPQYIEETLAWPSAWARTTSGRWPAVLLSEGQVQAVGTEARTLLGTVALTYSDPDNDTVDELATCSVATTVTDTSQIAVYFQASDRLDSDAVSEVYRIRPVKVAISGGTATVRIPSWLLVRPVMRQGVSPSDLDPADAATLAAQVEVYRRTTETASTAVATSQAVVTWETRPIHGWWCCCGCQTTDPFSGSPYDPAAVAQAVARVGIRDAAAGLVTPAEAAYDATAGTWAALDWSVCRTPDRVTIRTLSGLASPDGQQIARDWQTVVARL